jgi:acyl phosphate:glycerol-3-phosphate acyltransferase
VTELVIKILASYLLGSLIGSLMVGRLRGGVDIRELGSGNAGGTNALRTQGKLFALWVMVIDVGKGIVATRLIAPLRMPGGTVIGAGAAAGASVHDGGGALLAGEWLPVACGFAAIVGHVYPVWHGFRGGKGVATLVGVLLGLDVLVLLSALSTWVVTVALFGFVGLASMVAAASVPVFVAVSGTSPQAPLLAFGAASTLLVIFTHRSNIARMCAGSEPHARRVWLFGRGSKS